MGLSLLNQKWFRIGTAYFLFIMVAAPALGFCAQQEKPFTLAECYRLALKRSELIAIDAEKIREAESHFTQAFGTLLPHVSFSHIETRQDSQSSGNRYYEQKFVFTQTLFSGFKEFAAVAASKYEKKQRRSEKQFAEQLLFSDVADAFYLFLEEREDLQTLETSKKAFLNRIADLKTREQLGKSRESEVVSTQTQLYVLEDQIQSVKSRELIARELLEFITGQPVAEITEAGMEYAMKTEPEYLAQALSRSDVRAAEYAWRLAKKNTVIARSGFLPTVTAEGDYFTRRHSAPTDSDWLAQLTINVPIFEGTTTFGQVKEANAIARENELLFRRAQRLAAQNIQDAFANARYAFLRTAVLEQAMRSAELNYDLQKKDYTLSVVNNLDVLTALQSLQDVRRSYNHMYYESRRFYWQLQAAAGEITVDAYR
jgi:outer membrane protein